MTHTPEPAYKRFQCRETSTCPKCVHQKSHAFHDSQDKHWWIVCNWVADAADALDKDERDLLNDYMGQSCGDCGHTCGEATHKCEAYAAHVADIIAARAQS